MTSRRHFLAGSIAGSALCITSSARAAALQATSPETALSRLVCDTRFAQAGLIARNLASLGVEVFETQGDTTAIWYEQIAPGWRSGIRAIGGLTNTASLFTFVRLGFDAGLTVAFHGRHRISVDGSETHHAVDASPVIECQFAAALNSGLSWTSALQTVLPCAASRPSTEGVKLADIRAPATARETILHSWILTPRA